MIMISAAFFMTGPAKNFSARRQTQAGRKKRA